MRDDIFSKIIRGEIPCQKIYEDDKFLAFLDIHPVAEGHTLVVPKTYAPYVWDVENIGEYFETCQKLVKHFKKISGQEVIYGIIHGEGVPYAHVHIIPKGGKDLNEALHHLGLHESHKYLDAVQQKFKLN
jgi:histidine triad (HIT) family protein